MSSGDKGAAAASSRVSFPSNVRRTIEEINEIIGQNLGEDEIYAILKDCSMDPNEATQKLLLLDTFHEVKKKHDRGKEKKMSSGVKGAAAASSRVSIPSNIKRTIEDIKEIIGQNLGEDEIYAMLKDCSMDPNETAQKLLLFDTFHEVKKKRDRRKENQSKEPAELRWKPGSQARANRAGRGNT